MNSQKNNPLTGVLLLNGGKTFGRHKKRLLYKCIPHQGDPVLIPYEIKLGFSKHIKNKYISFHIIQPKTDHKPAEGQLFEVYGDVDDLNVYYEYQLMSRQLRYSLKMKTFDLPDTLFNRPIENRFFENVFTIDNEHTTEYDDAFSVKTVHETTIVSIYITNVASYVHYFQLWNKLNENAVSNIYLPHRKLNLLPPSLVDKFLSLKQGTERYTICLDITIDKNNNIVETTLTEAYICVKKNYVYESDELINHPHYQQLLSVSPPTVQNSYDLVSHWMEFYNLNIKERVRDKMKINEFIYVHHYNVPRENRYLVQLTQTNPKGYYTYSALEKNDYIHCTSPIRRIVDIYNQSILLSLNFAPLNIDFVNEKSKQVKKIQTECLLMNRCFNDPTIMNRSYSGFMFDKEKKGDLYKYTIYIEDLKMVSFIKSETDYSLFSHLMFQLVLFQDEHQINKKIKLKVIDTKESLIHTGSFL
jgi:hypothetical protein